METNWTLGTLIVVWAVIPILVLLLVGVVWGTIHQLNNKDPYGADGGMFLAALCGVFLLFGIPGVAFGMYPYETQYHSYTPFAGTVESVGSRLLSDGNSSVNLVYVVTFEGSPQQYKVNDTRMSLVNIGDPLAIQCVREWQFEGIDGWNCVYAGEDF